MKDIVTLKSKSTHLKRIRASLAPRIYRKWRHSPSTTISEKLKHPFVVLALRFVLPIALNGIVHWLMNNFHLFS